MQTTVEEQRTITAFGSLVLDSPLAYAHAAGALITMPRAAAPVPAPPNYGFEAKHWAFLVIVLVAIGCCICCVGFVGVFAFAKQRNKTRAFDKMQAEDRMYDMEEPIGPTESLIMSSPYKNQGLQNGQATTAPLLQAPVPMISS